MRERLSLRLSDNDSALEVKGQVRGAHHGKGKEFKVLMSKVSSVDSC